MAQYFGDQKAFIFLPFFILIVLIAILLCDLVGLLYRITFQTWKLFLSFDNAKFFFFSSSLLELCIRQF